MPNTPAPQSPRKADGAYVARARQPSARTALIGIIATTFLTIVHYALLSVPFNKVLTVAYSAKEAFSFVTIAAASVRVCMFVALPLYLIVVAKRWPIIWGLLPAALYTIYSAMLAHIKFAYNMDYGSLNYQLQVSIFVWVFAAVLGLVIRWIIRKVHSRRLAAQFNEPSGDAWPPPPVERLD